MRECHVFARTFALALCAASILPTVARADGLKVAIFDFEPVDLPQTTQMKARLQTYSDLVRKLFAEKGFTIVDLTPQAKKIADNLPLSDCNGCDQDIAKAAGADIEVTTAVQPSSSVIFSFSGNVKDVTTNRVLRSGVVDVRGTSDDEWNHGVKFLVNDRLNDPPLPKDTAELRKLVDSAPKDQDP